MRKRRSHTPSEEIDRNKRIIFRFDGRTYEAHPGDTVASALYAAGIRTFSRSFKYHRPRGLFCVSGNCPNCLVDVDGEPNVRSCVTPVRDGMVVHGQNAWPSVERDALSIADKFSSFMPPGFYYKRFYKPGWMWPIYDKVLRRMGGLGKLRIQNGREAHNSHGGNGEHWEKEYHNVDVAVVGGGPAGLAAALETGKLGLSVILVDEGQSPGGHLRSVTRPMSGPSECAGVPGHQAVAELATELEHLPNVSVWPATSAVGLYEGNLLAVLRERRFIQIRGRHIVVATGSFEQLHLFHNNDLPGIFLGRGLLKLMNLYGVLPGERVLVYGSHEESLGLACEVLGAGAKVVGVVGPACEASQGSPERERLESEHVPLFPGWVLAEAKGKSRVESARLVRGETGSGDGPTEQIIPCDVIALSAGLAPASDLLLMAGAKARFDHPSGEPVPESIPSGISGAGEVMGVHNPEAILLQGEIAGLEVALALGSVDASAAERLNDLRRELNGRQPGVRANAFGETFQEPDRKKRFVCLCEDVTEKDIRTCIGEGYDNIETLKRYSTIGMGPCQGKICNVIAARAFGRATGLSLDKTRLTTSRPPFRPLPMGALAGRHYQPIRRTPMHECHKELGARWLDVGNWKRPEWYTSTAEECGAVHENVGLIDVSTLGKLDIQGDDAVWLLEKVYNNRYEKLKVGRIRYGVMCDDTGIILDDGTVSRLAEDRYLVTTTTGGLENVEQWLKWWIVGTGRNAHVTNVTAAYGAVNLAGPKARDVLSGLTDLDLSNENLPYMAFAEGDVAGVPTRLLRIGFVGELGYEMHFPAEYGEYLWNALLEAGQPHGVKAFGVESQRILRLQKGHIIVSQDTDALSNSLEADMPWIVKLDKPDFIGRHALERVQNRGLRWKLIGFEMADASVVAEEGSQIVPRDNVEGPNARILGRVTSSRYSEFLGKSIGLGWIRYEMSQPGTEIWIRVKGRPQKAAIAEVPFYDEDGERLRM
ncbi:MAG: 2Fe-2S iron-sulfur cluster-binding protein [Nitrospinota bacterium]|nr:2Fe-2S iron-sulfur cluster-binding protein [Nitrospinota bacterium]